MIDPRKHRASLERVSLEPGAGKALLDALHRNRLAFDAADGSCREDGSRCDFQVASAFLHVDPVILHIDDALSSKSPRRALSHMGDLLRSGEPVPRWACRYLACILSGYIPSVPVPELRRGVATAGPVLEALLECVSRYDDTSLIHSVGTLFYRWLEARGDYVGARAVIARLLSRARDERDHGRVAILVNNEAFEFLLEGCWAEAVERLEGCVSLMRRADLGREVPNVEANLLRARWELAKPEDWSALVPELLQVNRRLVNSGDWRARKTMLLLARFAKARGRHDAAVGWARRAIATTSDVPTKLRRMDQDYLHTLEHDGRGRGRRSE